MGQAATTPLPGETDSTEYGGIEYKGLPVNLAVISTLAADGDSTTPWVVWGYIDKINGRHDQRREDAVGETQERYDHLAGVHPSLN
jgi:hypothetical protein